MARNHQAGHPTPVLAKLKIPSVPHDTNAPTIELENVSVTYNGHFVLENITFRLEPGHHVAVIGPNGAGKSTLFKVIAGILQPTTGHVRIYGHGPHGHICIAYVPQRNEIDWSFPVTVADVVMMGRIGKIGLFRRPGPKDWEIVHQSLARVGIADLADRQIGELSGGQQQRVFIARALAQEAELLLMDEPFTGLDIPSREAILQILDDLRGHPMTILVATHDLNIATTHFDLVMLLNRRIIALGPPHEVMTQETLLQAYGGSLHITPAESGIVLLTDSGCSHGEIIR